LPVRRSGEAESVTADSGPQDGDDVTAAPRVSLPVAVVMARRMVERGRWRVPSWHVAGVVAGAEVDASARGTPIAVDGDEEQFLWSGLRLELYRDAAHSYWANLTGTRPSLFVLCHDEGAGTLVPKLVTADQDEASSGVEVDERVYSAPIPPEVYQYLEAFVVEHHVPEEKHKRKRADWSAQGES
jgi:hypothetical protein